MNFAVPPQPITIDLKGLFTKGMTHFKFPMSVREAVYIVTSFNMLMKHTCKEGEIKVTIDNNDNCKKHTIDNSDNIKRKMELGLSGISK